MNTAEQREDPPMPLYPKLGHTFRFATSSLRIAGEINNYVYTDTFVARSVESLDTLSFVGADVTLVAITEDGKYCLVKPHGKSAKVAAGSVNDLSKKALHGLLVVPFSELKGFNPNLQQPGSITRRKFLFNTAVGTAVGTGLGCMTGIVATSVEQDIRQKKMREKHKEWLKQLERGENPPIESHEPETSSVQELCGYAAGGAILGGAIGAASKKVEELLSRDTSK